MTSRSVLASFVLLLSACGPAPKAGPADAGPADGGDMSGTCQAQDVPCVDQSISTLDLFTTVNPSTITEEGTTAGEFTTHIDATAGGLNATQSFIYAKFSDAGLTKVSIDDESAFTSTDWDIAFRRYIIRVNSGVSGPSCVQVARTSPSATFETVTSAPTNLPYRTEAYFTETCDYVSDASGLGGPGTAMASYWTYTQCLKMTGNVYVVKLASGRYVKLQVVSYYEPSAQQMCDSTDTIPTPSGSGNIRIRWAFLP